MGYHRIPVPIGEKYSQLTVVAEFGKKTLPSGQKIRVVRCVCDCGNYTDVAVLHLVRGRIKSCGCLPRTKKGESNSTLHRRWKAMHERCMYGTALYGIKKISVCSEWHDFFVFKKWALANGYSEDLQIDRIKNHLGYSPDNCRFVSSFANMANRDITFKITYNGVIVPFMSILRDKGIHERHHHTIRCRIKRGWSAQMAIDTPIRKGNYRTKK